MQDRLYTRATWGNTDFVVVDTGGLMSKAAQLPDGQRAAAERAISAAGLPQVPHQIISDKHTAAFLTSARKLSIWCQPLKQYPFPEASAKGLAPLSIWRRLHCVPAYSRCIHLLASWLSVQLQCSLWCAE